MIERRTGLRAMAIAVALAALLLGFATAAAHHGPPHPPKPRGGAPEEIEPEAAATPKKEKAKKEKAPKAAGVALGVPAAGILAPGALAVLQPATSTLVIAPLSAQVTDEIIARDHATMDALEARLASLPGAAADPWRATAARAWIAAARHEYDDNDPTGFPQAAFVRAAGLVHEIEAGDTPHTSESLPPAVPPQGSARVADSLYVRLEALKRHAGQTCAAATLAELEVALAWAGNEQAGPGACAASPHLERARALADQAARQAESCTETTPP